MIYICVCMHLGKQKYIPFLLLWALLSIWNVTDIYNNKQACDRDHHHVCMWWNGWMVCIYRCGHQLANDCSLWLRSCCGSIIDTPLIGRHSAWRHDNRIVAPSHDRHFKRSHGRYSELAFWVLAWFCLHHTCTFPQPIYHIDIDRTQLMQDLLELFPSLRYFNLIWTM